MDDLKPNPAPEEVPEPAWKKTLPQEGFTDSWLTRETRRKDAPRREVGDRRSGLCVRIEPNGTATWFYYQRLPVGAPGAKAKKKKHRLGKWPQVSIEAARELVEKLKAPRAPGGSSSALHPTSSVSALAEKFLAGTFANRKQEREAKERGIKAPGESLFRRFILPALGARPIALVSTTECAALVEQVASHGAEGKPAPVQAMKVYSLGAQLFRFAATFDLVKTNPFDAVAPKRVGARNGARRERCLSLAEVPIFWKALADGKAPLSSTAALVARILLLTGARKGELLQARWVNVDLEGKIWHIPREERKGDRAHDYPLAELAVSLFQELRQIGLGSEYVCTSPLRARAKHLHGESLNRAFNVTFGVESDPSLKPFVALEGGPIVPHDLRRSAKLLAARCDAKADWAEQEMMILGHAPPGVVAQHYDVEPDLDRHREIAESMAALVLQLVQGGKVVRLDARSRA